ncbi:MAG: RagB/SusD family nutrient uptake outer membrane protein [Bacteroidetes bacterium]|nr:RagB/SusD family nutrient uptake outer membrane protein [Bacteroidota bacterium]
MMRTYIPAICLLALMALLSACSRKSLLDENPSSELVVPSTLQDLQSLLDKDIIMSETPQLGELSADNYSLTPAYWQTLTGEEHNAYIWAKDIFGTDENIPDWNLPYQQVFYANVVLETLATIPMTSQNESQWKAIRGSALFIRAYAFHNLSQVFAPPYDSHTASTDLGIALRLASGVDNRSVRASVGETYNRILMDLMEAKSLLPSVVDSLYRNRPSKPAGMALLARVYLSMGNYSEALNYADSSLRLYSKLIDYNTVSLTAVYPFSRLNNETMYQSRLSSASGVLRARLTECVVDSLLYRSYTSADLRRQVFYYTNGNGLPSLRAGYSGNLFPFSGLATDEMFLIRAECNARVGNTTAALGDLNLLLGKRYKKDSLVAITAVSAGDALQKVLLERRKELAFRGLRWTDIRRLNKEGTGITLTRTVYNQSYQLPAGDARFVLPIPPDVIALSGMQQNLR